MTDRWHIALIEPQRERISCHVLRQRGYEVYYPAFPKKTTRGQGAIRTEMRPFFPGYMFVNQSPRGWEWLRTAPGVRTFNSLLMINGRYAILPDGEIQRIAEKEEGLIHQILHPPPRTLPYAVGDQVKVIDGPFGGWLATIETLDDEERISLLMDIFGRESRVFASHTQLAAT